MKTKVNGKWVDPQWSCPGIDDCCYGELLKELDILWSFQEEKGHWAVSPKDFF